MVEKDLENALAGLLQKGSLDRSILREVRIDSATNDVSSVYDLIGDHEYVLFQDTSDWNHAPKLLMDVAGGTTPDIVLRSKESNENRIYIEVKYLEELRYEIPLSQIVRQFLHLLATTRRLPLPRAPDIRRAVLLAAPTQWFEKQSNLTKWRYFLDKYADLAKLPTVDITLGEIRLDRFLS